jgi:septal ring factor EnvC (AmiA/AmiB activator)
MDARVRSLPAGTFVLLVLAIGLAPSGSRAQPLALATADRIAGLPVPGAALPESLESLDGRIATAQSTADRLGAERQRVDAEVHGLLTERGATQRRLRSRVNALYRMRRAGLLPLAGGFDALLRHQSRVERLERMVTRDVEALHALQTRITALQAETARLATETERADRELAALRERRGVIERVQASAWAAPSVYADVQPLDAPPSLGFVHQRGQLPLPVSGSVRLQEAEREGGAGLDVLAPAGVPVRSVAAGRVAYAAPHPTYGRLVIVDHGEGFYTVYGGLGGITASVGQTVAPSSVIGSSAGLPVFFQVRQGTRPLSAREWLGL